LAPAHHNLLTTGKKKMNAAFIKLEVEGMKHVITKALSEHMLLINADISAAVDKFCTSENLEKAISDNVGDAMREVVQDCVRSHLGHGSHKRRAVEAEVFNWLKDNYPLQR
jgi:hypothetical protein